MPDLSRRRIKELTGLRRKKHRDALEQCLVEGVRSVESAVTAGAPLVELLVAHEVWADARVAALVAHAAVPVHAVAASDLDRIADTATTQGVAAVARTTWCAPDALRGAVVALDGVQDPGNVGAILRSAAWFGVDGVLVGPGTADPFGPKAVRAAMGGLWDVDLAASLDLAADLAAFRAGGGALFGADLEGDPVRDWSPPNHAVLVLGSEAHGVSPPVRALLDGRVRIGTTSAVRPRGVESLNVAVATGILLQRWLGD